MALNENVYKGRRHIRTTGAWIEGEKVQVEFEHNCLIKFGERVVRYSAAAGDLYITIYNNRYFLCEFE